MAPVIALKPDALIMADPGLIDDGARDLAGHAHPSLGAGQHGELRGGAVLEETRRFAASSCRANCRSTRSPKSARNARTWSWKCSSTARCASPIPAAACCPATSTTATPTRAPAPIPAAGTTRSSRRGRRAGHGDVLTLLRREGTRAGQLHAHRGRRARHLHPQLEGSARHRTRAAADRNRRRLAQDRRPHQVALLRGAHLPGLSPGHRRRRRRPPARPDPAAANSMAWPTGATPAASSNATRTANTRTTCAAIPNRTAACTSATCWRTAPTAWPRSR